MIIVHDIFICKEKKASQFAKLMKQTNQDIPSFVRVMTDAIGQYNKVVVVSQYDNLTAYDQRFKDYQMDSEETLKLKEMMKGYHDLYLTGSREVYQHI